MSERVTKTITDVAQVNRALNWLDGAFCKALETGPVAIDIYRPEDGRTSPQNARYHAMIADIQKQAIISIPGRRIKMADYDMDACKALLVVWFARERELNGEPLSKPPRSIVDPTTGERVQIRPSTAQWGKRDASDFVEWLYSLGADCKVAWSEPALSAYEQYLEKSE